ncbi:MAG: hypothetical protein U0736_04925 [Gemmataceae bacterium]
MPTLSRIVPPLLAGDHLSRAEFLRRWDALPDLKRAELIGGVVYMRRPSVPTTPGRTTTSAPGWVCTRPRPPAARPATTAPG